MYCHFAIDPRRPGGERQERYTRAVLREMQSAERSSADTLYFGGGTPSLLAPERIVQIVEVARDRFAVPRTAEITLEANPRDPDVTASAGERVLATRDRAAEALFTGLRRSQGVDLAAYQKRYDLDPLAAWGEGLDAARAAGLVAVAHGRLRLTDRGMLLSNEVFQAFV